MTDKKLKWADLLRQRLRDATVTPMENPFDVGEYDANNVVFCVKETTADEIREFVVEVAGLETGKVVVQHQGFMIPGNSTIH